MNRIPDHEPGAESADQRPATATGGRPGEAEATAPVVDGKDRRDTVTDEPFRIHESVLGLPLASIRRRAAALFVDGIVCWIFLLPFVLALAFGVMYLRTPGMFWGLIGAMSGAETADNRAAAEMIMLVSRERPELLPADLAEAVRGQDLDAVIEALEGVSIQVMGEPVEAGPSYYDGATGELYVRRDVFFGPYAFAVSGAGFVIAFFTIATWVGGGRTPGKWLFGLRIVRLDGKPLTLWDAFSRAGGYVAGLSTVLFGFFEARWDPNRQAIHDKIVGTVVVREPRRGVADDARRPADA